MDLAVLIGVYQKCLYTLLNLPNIYSIFKKSHYEIQSTHFFFFQIFFQLLKVAQKLFLYHSQELPRQNQATITQWIVLGILQLMLESE